MASPPQIVHHISRSMVKPSPLPQSSNELLCNLTPWDISLLSAHYVQWGLLFSNLPLSLHNDRVINCLRTSLSAALFHFYPLAGRFLTEEKHDGMFISLDCNGGEGAEFIHAIADKLTVGDVLAPFEDVPCFIRSFFPLNGAINYDGHFLPLLAIQVTELADGFFLGCSFNHAVGDGTSFWNFFHAWAEICRTKVADEAADVKISHPPIHDRWFLEGVNPPIRLPFSRPDEFIERYSPPPDLRVRFFHMSSQSIARLKSEANDECKTDDISSFQALCALVWRSVTRARRLPPDQRTSYCLAANNRSRLRPPLPTDYFGNAAVLIGATATVGELLARGLGWGAWLVHQSVVAHTDSAIRSAVRAWMEAPVTHRPSGFDRYGVTMGSSPRFDVYGCDFGWGKAVALRSGNANRYDGKVSSYMGREGGGSMDLEVCLSPDVMGALEADEEFMSAISQ